MSGVGWTHLGRFHPRRPDSNLRPDPQGEGGRLRNSGQQLLSPPAKLVSHIGL